MKNIGLGHLLFTLGLLSVALLSESTLGDQGEQGVQRERLPLFNEKDNKMMNYLTSPQFLLDKNTVEIVSKSRQRMKIALKVYAEKDRLLRQQFFKGDIWEKEEQRENYFALKRLLQEVSPITKNKEKK
jgi:hypothetical protein